MKKSYKTLLFILLIFIFSLVNGCSFFQDGDEATDKATIKIMKKNKANTITYKDEEPPVLFVESNVNPHPMETVSNENGVAG